MSSVALLLGPVAFQDFEVPASINIGGKQRLVVHHLPGGARVIDVLGGDDSDLCFSGIFSGGDATLRALTVDELRVAGLPLTLTWDVFYYTVIINKFEADYRSGWWIPFRVCCTVVSDETSSAVDSAIPSADGVLSDVTTASTAAAAAGIDLSNALTAAEAPGAPAKGTAAYVSMLATLVVSSTLVGAGISGAQSTLEAVSWPVNAEAPAVPNILNVSLVAAQQICSLTVAQAYIGRAIVNLESAST